MDAVGYILKKTVVLEIKSVFHVVLGAIKVRTAEGKMKIWGKKRYFQK